MQFFYIATSPGNFDLWLKVPTNANGYLYMLTL